MSSKSSNYTIRQTPFFPAYLKGSLRTRKYTDSDGAERYVTEIRGDRMQMLGAAPQRQSARAAAPSPTTARQGGAGHFDDLADDFPF